MNRIVRRAGRLVRAVTRKVGVDIVRYEPNEIWGLPPDLEPHVRDTIKRVKDYTMTSSERVNALCKATEYVVAHAIPGAFVECGVWRGGSMMAVALTLLRLKATDRDLFLFDTFEGMPDPSEADVNIHGREARKEWRYRAGDAPLAEWCNASIDEVRRNMATVGYPAQKVHYVKGRVEETVPGHAPEAIAILRLDTDWYESTRHELEHLYPRIPTGGILLLDDYGHWQGARRAVDEYLEQHRLRLLLHRIDYSGRIAVKV